MGPGWPWQRGWVVWCQCGPGAISQAELGRPGWVAGMAGLAVQARAGLGSGSGGGSDRVRRQK